MLLSHIHHSSPSGGRDMLDKLATFALAQGWTVELQANVTWEDTGGSYYDWVSGGDNYFLQIRSTGYGSQDLTYRFWIDPQSSADDWMFYNPVKAGFSSYSHSVSTNPVWQDIWKGKESLVYDSYRFDWLSLPHSTFSDVWLVGNDKVLAVHMKVSSTHIISFAVGTFELITELQSLSGSEGQCHWSGSYANCDNAIWSNIDSHIVQWSNCWAHASFVSPTGLGADKVIFWRGAHRNTSASGQPGDHYRINMRGEREVDPGMEGAAYHTHFNVLPDCCVFNDWTQKWTLMRPTVYLSNTLADGTFIAAGWLPMYYLRWTNLVAGDIIKFGLEEYIVFPTLLITSPYGIAYRVS